MGAAHVAKYGATTALLAKALDSAERLTIQVHPDPATAQSLFQSRFGKCFRMTLVEANSCVELPPGSVVLDRRRDGGRGASDLRGGGDTAETGRAAFHSTRS
ncbi:hypothetical protein [Paenibacillus cymbidii]|uniref:hypothetical protein n=1 Tax=Paenibacillus cymbidii TaxID=1639034 RepID=UPI00108025A2|nr:hypothetical protein [Paenibacillus cymbidii]